MQTPKCDALVKINHEVNVLESLIKNAEADADQDLRIRFCYDWVCRDLKQIKNGIFNHTNRLFPCSAALIFALALRYRR